MTQDRRLIDIADVILAEHEKRALHRWMRSLSPDQQATLTAEAERANMILATRLPVLADALQRFSETLKAWSRFPALSFAVVGLNKK